MDPLKPLFTLEVGWRPSTSKDYKLEGGTREWDKGSESFDR